MQNEEKNPEMKGLPENAFRELKKDEKYVVTFETLSGITTTSYLLQDKDGKTQVTFKEEFKSRNGKSSAGLFESLFKKRSIKKLRRKR